jgi:transketolase
MAAVCNGIWAYGGLKPFCATFLNFIGYALGSVRLSALSQFGVLYIMTHDSIGLGEDGPTHQPIEMLEVLRATPNLYTIRPCDGNETVGAYIISVENPKTPTVMAYSRQAVPTLEGSSAEKTLLGAYVMSEFNASEKRPHLVIVATGTEVSLAITVAKKLAEDNFFVRVVSMPCCELFDQQSQDYKLSIFPEGSPVMSLEALGTRGWKEYAHAPYGMTRFGASGPGAGCYKLFGFTTENVCVHAKEVISFYGEKGAPSLVNVPQFPSYPLNSNH